MLCFSHFQVMPEFIDFLLPFGFRSYAQDFYFNGFRQWTYLAQRGRSTTPITGSANKGFQICFSLKSAEPSDTDQWSIRHCAVHHSFDVKEVRTSWIIVKGDQLMKRRVESATSDQGPYEASDFGTMQRAFETSLKTHLIICDWSAEHWRWYINSLEDKFQNMTRRTFSAPLSVPLLPAADTDRFTLKTHKTNDTQRTDRSVFSFSETLSHVTEKWSPRRAMKQAPSISRTYTNPETGISQPLPPDEDEDEDGGNEPETLSKPYDPKDEEEHRDFSFGKLRKVHKIAEDANEALLVLKQNVIVLKQLKRYYGFVSGRKDFPKDLADSCTEALGDFDLRIEGIENDMQTQILRLETMLRLLEDRKTLVKQIKPQKKSKQLKDDQLHSILDYQNTQTNKYSTRSMTIMTEDMNDIARKTKVETVSMKVITLVTLCFLPSTFISVSLVSPSVNSFDEARKPLTVLSLFISLHSSWSM